MFGIVDDTVFDGVLHSADALHVAGFVIEPVKARSVKDLQIFERVLIDDDKVGQQTGADDSEFNRLAFRFMQGLGGIERSGADDFERMESGFAEQFQYRKNRRVYR